MKLVNSLELENFLAKNKLKPSHALGQNFLVDKNVLNKILEAGELDRDDEVVEVGSGLGVLTAELATRVKKVVALEFDAKIFPKLQENLSEIKNVELKNIDVRRFIPPATPYKLIANIPYYLTSPILRKFFIENGNPPKVVVLLVQKEVAQKICNAEKLSVLSLEVKLFGNPEIIEIVKPVSFLPPPKVDSAILKISLKEKFEVRTEDIKDFFKILYAGFHSPRKKIRGSFASGLAQKKEVAFTILKQAGIDENLRPENLSINDWKRILEVSREVISL